ncbi:alginate lyase family protein [Cyclobacterium marinum]|uniref:Alginate lyase domain-containing protein n=1 Tax=Cyclobacterium marinum (strain ATCC 25205 / DSM 745 / LMG 13164 / NCIMB 1802) TaxID=880070 RepID=G0J4B3_CYCMS|nr:alginate lyase family protein [Cyclobacterium marinum]AEL27539.1 hypothetical protein Cycma_3828 [Cyclobacterium marinum DSM 745]
MSFYPKNQITLIITLVFVLISSDLLWAQKEFILWEGAVLNQAKQNSGTSMAMPEMRKLENEAEMALKSGPFSVVHKKQLPPSGDIHDYTSMGPYWWPDPEKEDGLPYIRRDGEINPEFYDYKDHDEFGALMKSLNTLSKAYYFLENEQYAQYAIRLIKTWFLDSETRMNPNLNYAQRIPGRTEGRGIGIIDTRRMAVLPDVLKMLSASEHWEVSMEKGMKDWLAAYVSWLVNSKHGKDEAVHGNNHTTWYFAQIIPLTIYLDQSDRADSLAKAGLPLILEEMIEKDGSQPAELARTISWNYSSMNLLAIMYFAQACEKVGINLWDAVNEKGGSIAKGMDFLFQYTKTKNDWPYKQIKPLNPVLIKDQLNIAAYKYGNKKYKKVADQMISESTEFSYWDLVNFKQISK